jgi:LEA14-like dessication related protein
MRLKIVGIWLIAMSSVVLSCTEVKEPEFRAVEKFRIKSLGIAKSEIGFQIRYYNPNNFRVQIKDGEADVMIDSVSLGKFSQDSLAEVGRESEFTIPLTGFITLDAARKLKIETLPFREVNVVANGSVKVGKSGIFIKKPVRYEGRHRLSVQF